MKPENKALTILKSGNDFILRIEIFLMAAFTIALVAAIFIEVVCRYMLFISTAWAEEISRYLFIWLTYIGSAYALCTRGHIEIDIFRQVIEKFRFFKNKALCLKILDVVSIVSTTLFLIIFCKIFWDYMMKFWGSIQTSPTIHIPMGLVYLPVFVGSAIGIYHEVFLFYTCLKSEPGVKNA